MNFSKLLKYELLGILRNRWILFFPLLFLLISGGFLKISGDAPKAVLALSHVTSVALPLISLLFTVVYWYHAERFTEWLLTQPVGRFEILAARWCALTLALTTTLGVGLTSSMGV